MNDKPDKYEFELTQRVTLSELEQGKKLYSADYTPNPIVEAGKEPYFLQFNMKEDPSHRISFKMVPGIFKLEVKKNQVIAEPMETQNNPFLEQSRVFNKISMSVNTFFNKIPVYNKLGFMNPKRGILLHSKGGYGKSSTIVRIARKYSQEHKTCVIFWPSDRIEPDALSDFLTESCDWSGVDYFLLVVEDIGGGHSLGGTKHTRVGSSLLNFLDGAEQIFQKPTFMISTTNSPDALLDTITSRPGRFDELIEIKAPDDKEREAFLKFFSQGEAEVSAKVIGLTKGFSIAHLKECWFRHVLFDKTLVDAATEIQEWIKKAEKTGLAKETQEREMGFGSQPTEDMF